MALVLAAACGASQVAGEPTADEEARAAAREVASARFPGCPEVTLSPVRQSSRCVEDVPVERWALDENGDFVGDGCERWESYEITPGAQWKATGCGRTEMIHCGGCDGSMSTCYDEDQVGLIDCVTAERTWTRL